MKRFSTTNIFQGKAKIQNATYVNTKEKAQMHFANLISHRAQVKVFIDEFLMKQLLKLFNNKEEKAKEVGKMKIINGNLEIS